MKFELDKQTIEDLKIFRDDIKSKSVFTFFNRTKTLGGQEYLHNLMLDPLTDVTSLKKRLETIKELTITDFSLTINNQQFDFINHYIKLNTVPLKSSIINASLQHISYLFKPSNDYYIIKTGIQNLLYLFQHLKELLKNPNLPQSLASQIKCLRQVTHHKDFLFYFDEEYKLDFNGISKLDSFIRGKYNTLIMDALEVIHQLDAFISIARTARENELAFPVYVETELPHLEIENLYHPALSNPIPYNISIQENKNLCFLTGPNMAGKSTFLKAVGLSIYLSHIGFPVPAKAMKTSIYNGLITTINLTDNLNKGYSHFYSEVRRVKETAHKLKANTKLFVIFDELFRGTNVKDSFDASLLIIEAFAKVKKSTFFISTHITEIATEINFQSNINFKYFESKIIDNDPVYNYKISDGVSQERLGMLIVKNEGIIEILESINEKEKE